MNTDDLVLQGCPYLFETEKNIVCAQATLCDPVNADMLQSAVDAVMAHTDYFNMRLICEKEQFSLCPNDAPCTVYYEDKCRRIPEETNNYLFYVSFKDYTVSLFFGIF